MKTIRVSTGSRVEFQPITGLVQRIVDEEGIDSGLCHVFVTHTTAGLTINENADPDVVADIINTLDRLVPQTSRYRHSEGNSPAHIKASLMGSALSIPISGGRLELGTWQGIFLCEFDGPRTRQILVSAIPGSRGSTR